MNKIEKFLSLFFTLLTNPKILVIKIMRHSIFLPFSIRLKFDAVSPPTLRLLSFSSSKRGKGLRNKRKIPKAWNEQVYILHLFSHPLYNEYIYPVMIGN